LDSWRGRKGRYSKGKYLKWAGRLNAEDETGDISDDEILIPEEVNRLIYALKNHPPSIYPVTGFQGTGKTTFWRWLGPKLCKEGVKAARVRWDTEKGRPVNPRIWRSEFSERFDIMYKRTLEKEMIDRLGDYEVNMWAKFSVHVEEKSEPGLRLRYRYKEGFPMSKFERYLPKGKLKEIKKKAVFRTCLEDFDVVLIDFGDYRKNRKTRFKRDLKKVEELWHEVKQRKEGEEFFRESGVDEENIPTRDISLVLFIQKELFGDDFFLGKMQPNIFELPLYEPEELLTFFRRRFGSRGVFSDGAVLRIGRLSMGRFRYFKAYIRDVLQEVDMKGWGFPIDSSVVDKVISADRLASDLEFYLMDVFSKRSKRVKAIKVLKIIWDKEQAEQKKIAEILGLGEMETSRILSKLEDKNLIQREPKKQRKGNIKIVKPLFSIRENNS